MLQADRTAFIEQMDVTESDKRAQKYARRLREAELDVLRLTWDMRASSDAIKALDQAQATDGRPGASARRVGSRSPGDVERERSTLKARIETASKELARKQERLRRLQAEAPVRPDRQLGRIYRLHSAEHHVECSTERFARLCDLQLHVPVWVATKQGRRWWWYLDRFWWDDEGLTSEDVKMIVLETDLDRREYHDALEQARAEAFDRVRSPDLGRPLLESVRFEVWRRDEARCVDCGTALSLEFDYILPIEAGGSDAAPNVELRCRTCRMRRAHNMSQAVIGRARLEMADPQASELIPVAVRQEVWERDKGRCSDCGTEIEVDFDYIVPPGKGGTAIAANVELRCRPCRERRAVGKSPTARSDR